MLTLLLAIISIFTPLIFAENSQPINLVANNRAGNYLYTTKIDDFTYKVSTVGFSGFASHFSIHDVQNINNASIHAPQIGPDAIMDVYRTSAGGVPTSQVFVRTNMTYDDIPHWQQISIADNRLNYYTWDYQYIFYFCETPILTDDDMESTTTLFMRRSEVNLPEGCWDTTFSTTRQGFGRG
ncbi:uncharacterized protein RCC_04117 [Ramularia collo-cygni]|uniref:Uncharacterized protein n=1 Tax=Ramularia collo-cygni TaxID=112498 RepID=A0A2D3UP97_9PEZI|nr:uncharacterized protein RCC_04117 [Ramularia collo-cygni]CZT18272.1 uncharacterized protein RCC_04117 [Ramularia collo-cygni]